MKVLVTGASGFIGQNLLLALTDLGYQVRVLVRNSTNSNRNVESIVGDITNPDDVKKATKNVEVVFNLAAALPHHNLKDSDYWKTNVEGIKNILDACVENKVQRLIHVSTVGIYDKRETAYTKSKTEAERLVNLYRKEQNLAVVIVRPTIAYGPFDIRPGFSNLFPLIQKGKFIPVGNGENYFHSVYVGNLVQALIICARDKKAIGHDFIIGDDPCPKMKDIIRTIAEVEGKKLPAIYIPLRLALLIGKICDLLKIFGLPAPLPTRRVRFITDNRKYDLTEAKKVLNFTPKFSLQQGIEATYLWYKEQGVVR